MASGARPGPDVASAKQRGMRRASLHISTRFGSDYIDSDDSYLKDEHKRITGEIAGLEKELANFNEKAVAEKVRNSLQLELERKRLRLRENELARKGKK